MKASEVIVRLVGFPLGQARWLGTLLREDSQTLLLLSNTDGLGAVSPHHTR